MAFSMAHVLLDQTINNRNQCLSAQIKNSIKICKKNGQTSKQILRYLSKSDPELST